jgi:2-polyprenyl-3-methyl-5-hydroxy-6-metoxy-1,4-benzoquinol methylase
VKQLNKKLLKKTFEDVPCNLCGSKEYKILYKECYNKETQKDLIEKFRAAGDETLIDQVVKCNKCGLIYINPRIKSDLILKGYSEGSDEVFVSQARGRELTFAKSLRTINKYCPKKGRILDIGTAGGSFLYVAKKDGWDVHGVEPNKWMAAWGKKHYGVDIKPGTLFDHKYPDNYFDVVTLWDVLEHVPDPSKTLKEVNRILKKGGLLVVNYPDIGSWIAKLLRRKWMFLLSVHLWYFTPKTIKLMLNKHHFSILKIKPHFQQLALGYLAHRTKAYNKLISSIGEKIVHKLGWHNKQASYWIGQTLIIAKKVV